MSPLDTLRRLIGKRSSCYRSVFDLERRDSSVVLQDLEEFCRVNESTFHADPRIHALLEGRREVWLRIQNYARLTDSELLALRLGAMEAKKNPD